MELTRKLTKGEKTEQVIIYVVLTIFALCAILPFILLLASSLTDEQTIKSFGYSFWPREWSTYAYEYLFKANGKSILRAYGITLFVTVFGTCLSLIITPMIAYALSRRDFKRAAVYSFLVFFTIIFNGGVVPSYIMWNNLFEIKNTIWALVFPNLVTNGFLITIAKNFFSSSIHPALLEAARIDGAGETQIYLKIVLPQSLPIIATLGLMVGLGYWNDWVNGLYYLTNTELYSLQVMLNSILLNAQALAAMGGSASTAMALPSTTVRMAIAVIGVIPVMALYPFFQKYFVKGIMLGGVKE